MARPIIDLVISNVNIYNTFLKRIIPGDITISQGRFFSVGTYDLKGYDIRQRFNGDGRIVIPGLIDVHLHVESSMVTPLPFAEELIRHGVTTVVADPHEIANVFGVDGIEAMIAAGKNCISDIFYAVPSCVPATDLETAGSQIDFSHFDRLIHNPQVICLGEVMSYVQLVKEANTPIHDLLAQIRQHYPRTVIEGHCPNYLGLDLATFMYYGPDSDHTMQTPVSIEERVRLGMMVQIQDKSITPEVIDFLRRSDLDEHIALITDDVAPDKLVDKGHLDYLIRKCISYGLKPETAVYWASYTPARRMNLLDRGAIAPGKLADFVMVNSIENFDIQQVYKNGKLFFDGKTVINSNNKKKQFATAFYKSVKLGPVSSDDFILAAPEDCSKAICQAMRVRDMTTYTEQTIAEFPVKNQVVQWEKSDWALAAVFHRHGHNHNRAYGIVGGEIIRHGAIATTYAHDSHNLLVVGHTAQEMALAVNRVIALQGGICLVQREKVLTEISLPIAGLMAETDVDEMAAHMRNLVEAMKKLGCNHSFPIMSLATLSLPVSPSLKLTDLGLVDVLNKKIVPLFVSTEA